MIKISKGKSRASTSINKACLFFLSIFFISSCSIPKGKIKSPSPVILSIKESRAKSFKGYGKIALFREGKIEFSARALWLGAEENRLRIELRTLSGVYLASVSWDGKWFYLLLPDKRRFYKKRLSSSSLKPLLRINISPSDIYYILSGSIPVRDHKTSDFVKGKTLILKGTLGRTLQKIYLQKNIIKYIEIFNMFEKIDYRFKKDKSVVISDNKNTLKINIQKLMLNVPVPASVFVIKGQ